MTKAISLVMSLVTVLQIIRPLGLPGLKRRADAWKIAAVALALVLAVALTKGE